MTAHTALWSSPTPLWGRFRSDSLEAGTFLADDQARPAILRFASDEFMDQLLALLAADPRQLGDLVARPETWRSPAGETPDLIDRVALPRIARSLARLRSNDAPVALLDKTAHEVSMTENGVSRTLPLKLYQPAHQRYYLVAANLVCGVPGFPDRALATGGKEQVGFVLRRLLPTAGGALAECAFVKQGSTAQWRQVAAGANAADPQARLEDEEELLPLFPLNFRDDMGHPRRMLAGMIPVGRREQYMTTRKQASSSITGAGSGTANTSPPSSPNGATEVTRRKEQFKLDVSEPWKTLVRTAHDAAARNNDTKGGGPRDAGDPHKAAVAVNDQLQWQSWFVLLDFADYLSTHLPAVWDWVIDAPSKPTLSANAQQLFDWLKSAATAPPSGTPMTTGARVAAANLRDALVRVRQATSRARLESATLSFPKDSSSGPSAWPDFHYPLTGLREDSATSFTAVGVHLALNTQPPPSNQSLDDEMALLDKLVQLVVAAIDTTRPSAPAPPIPFAAELRDALDTTAGDPGWFVVRCAYRRPDCGPLHPGVLSVPSQRFQLAAFFDPDAPARPIRIALPVDTTPAGLRKFNKNTAFMLSDVLCGQVQRAKGLGLADLVLSVLPWPFHKDLDVGEMGPCGGPGATFGMICSLSIPIITICALILLIVIVLLLDFIFKWIPWFIVCFPVPGMKGKK